jgi:hypothetical protein
LANVVDEADARIDVMVDRFQPLDGRAIGDPRGVGCRGGADGAIRHFFPPALERGVPDRQGDRIEDIGPVHGNGGPIHRHGGA